MSGRKARSPGTAPTRSASRLLANAERQGLFDPVKPVEPPALAEDDRIGGHFGVLSDFVAAVRAGAEPETAGRDNIRSLAMVFGAIESAEAQRRVSIVV